MLLVITIETAPIVPSPELHPKFSTKVGQLSTIMSCQSGIRADDDVKAFFQTCKQGKVRLAKFVINKEKLSVSYHSPPTADWKADWKRELPNCVDSYEPCFILFRLETQHEWILISFADDKASARDKMVLAATKATFKSDFGQSHISAEYQIANTHEFNLDIFERRMRKGGVRDTDDTTMSNFERDVSAANKERIALPFAMQSTQTLRGVQFPVDQDATALIRKFGKGELDFVQLSVDTLNEAIKLEQQSDKLSAAELNSKIPKKKPRYSLFRLRDVDEAPVFFIYSIPPSAGCTIKELMLYSSCKAPFLSEIDACGVKIDKRIEVDSRDVLDSDALISSWRPTVAEPKTQFAKPPRPGGGPRRITTAAE
uniref:Twinfilin n=1 Tax=Panagrellus redivivus TaxID=6233 RepID=A0A7E4W0R1_PANRE